MGAFVELSEESVISAASLKAIAELLQVGHAIEMNEGCGHHQHMEYLVWVKLRREPK